MADAPDTEAEAPETLVVAREEAPAALVEAEVAEGLAEAEEAPEPALCPAALPATRPSAWADTMAPDVEAEDPAAIVEAVWVAEDEETPVEDPAGVAVVSDVPAMAAVEEADPARRPDARRSALAEEEEDAVPEETVLAACWAKAPLAEAEAAETAHEAVPVAEAPETASTCPWA